MVTMPKMSYNGDFDVTTPGGYITLMMPSKYIKYTVQEANRAAGLINDGKEKSIDIATLEQCEILIKE
jgi:hypothetical protein